MSSDSVTRVASSQVSAPYGSRAKIATFQAQPFTQEGAVAVQVSFNTARQELTIAVEDTGPGIAPDDLARIFDSFAQGDASTTRRFGVEAARAIHGQPRNGHGTPRMVALTASMTALEHERCLAAGMDVVLAKPVDVNALIALLEETQPHCSRPPDEVVGSALPGG